jgi:uncharacterized RDD family membrane protein YckC
MSKDTEFHVLQGRAAGFVTRLIAYFVDLVVVTGILALSGWLAVVADNLIATMGLDPGIDVATIYTVSIPFIIGTYFVVLWALTGRTIGKWLMGLKVVGRDGLPPTIGRSLLRLIGYSVSLLFFWGGYLWVIIDDERQGWHDHIARTWVIYDYERLKRGQIYENYRMRTKAKQTKR